MPRLIACTPIRTMVDGKVKTYAIGRPVPADLDPDGELVTLGALEEVEGDEFVEPPVQRPLSKMTKAELTEEAGKVGVEIAEGATNAQIADAIEAKRRAAGT